MYYIMNMYVQSTYIITFRYIHVHGTDMYVHVRDFMNMSEHIHTVCTMFRRVCTGLPNPVQVVRIPDVRTPSRAQAQAASDSEQASETVTAGGPMIETPGY